MSLSNVSKLSELRNLSMHALQSLASQVAKHTHVELPDAIEAERGTIATLDAGEISYYADRCGSGRPLLLLHGVHAAASAYEQRLLFDAWRGQRPLYAPDLPGFGFSQRGGVEYTDKTYVSAIEHLLRHIANERPGERADVVALSLSSEYVAAAVRDLPELVHSLVMISPTGFDSASRAPRASMPSWLKTLAGGVGELFFSLLVTRPSLRYFLRKSFAGPIDAGMFEYAYATSHQPGAQHAPLAFVQGSLFPSESPQEVYARLELPVLVLYDLDPYSGFEGLDAFVTANPTFAAERISPTRGLPQIEASAQTVQRIEAFWDGIAQREDKSAA